MVRARSQRDIAANVIKTFDSGEAWVFGIDETIERRRGEKIAAKGIYRDGVRSSKSHFVKASVQRNLHSDIDRSNRRDLSLFRIAWGFLQRTLLFNRPFQVSFAPFFGALPNFHPCGW
ncbi:MAG: hypothetical protein ABI947_26825 [Chloroflexota bacterium]